MRLILSLTIIITLAASLAIAEPVPPTTSVWTTASNSYYHTQYCKRIKVGFNNKAIPIQLAIEKKFKPHPKCKPPTEISSKVEPEKLTRPRSIRIAVRKGPKSYMGQSAADIPKNPDGTGIGSGGGGLSIVTSPGYAAKKPTLKSSEAEQGFKVLSVSTKKIKRDSFGDVWFSIKILVRNYSKNDQTLYVPLQGLDSTGFELTRQHIKGRIAGNATDYLTTKTFMNATQFSRIVRWTAE